MNIYCELTYFRISSQAWLQRLLAMFLSQSLEILFHYYISTSTLSSNVALMFEKLADLETSDINEFHAMQHLCVRLIQRLLQIFMWFIFWFETTCFSFWFIQQRFCFFNWSCFFNRFDSSRFDEIETQRFLKNCLSCRHFNASHFYYKWLISNVSFNTWISYLLEMCWSNRKSKLKRWWD